MVYYIDIVFKKRYSLFVFTELAVDTKLVECFRNQMGANNSRYRFWYDLENSAFQYNQRMSKYPFDVRFWVTVSYKR